jgi:hypothetical protein
MTSRISRIWVAALTGALIGIGHEPAFAQQPAETPSPMELKEGWGPMSLTMASAGCTQGMMASIKDGYYAGAKRAGVDHPKPFQEERIADSVSEMCGCVILRVASIIPFDELSQHADEFRNIMKDAISGGQCAPTGFFGEMIKKNRESSEEKNIRNRQ